MIARVATTIFLAATPLLGGCSSEDLPPPADDSITVFCGTLIDGIADEPFTNQAVVISDGRIKSILDDKPSSGTIVDLSDHTCLPGLIDSHTHMAELATDNADLSVHLIRSNEERQEIGRQNAAKTLGVGFTAVRNVGSYDAWSAAKIRDRINAGEIPGPRMRVAGFYLTVPGGGGDLVIPGFDESDIPPGIRQGVSAGPDEFRLNAQKAVDGGADFLKVIASGAVLAFGGMPGAPEMTSAEIEVVTEVAHAAGFKVTAHAHGAQSIKEAILAGADTIEHASLADDEAIALALEHDVAFSMDIYNGTHIATIGREQGWPEVFLRKNDETTEAQRQVFTKAHAAGVPIIYGTDAAVYPHGDNAKMFPVMVERGMTPMEAIQAATSVAANYIGWSDDVGAIEPGRYGDLIALKANPLADITALQDIDVVIKGGERFK
jgi:imidazolonepropionase-like amidohydrolase